MTEDFAAQYRRDLIAGEFPSDVIINAAKLHLINLHRLRPDAPDRNQAIANVTTFLREQGVSELYLAGLAKSIQRPANYHELPPSEQWAIDRRLGILDWEGI